jgi:hypothetical protein
MRRRGATEPRLAKENPVGNSLHGCSAGKHISALGRKKTEAGFGNKIYLLHIIAALETLVP